MLTPSWQACCIYIPNPVFPYCFHPLQYLDGTEVDVDLVFDNGVPVYGAITVSRRSALMLLGSYMRLHDQVPQRTSGWGRSKQAKAASSEAAWGCRVSESYALHVPQRYQAGVAKKQGCREAVSCHTSRQ